jgi:hypothetical protein
MGGISMSKRKRTAGGEGVAIPPRVRITARASYDVVFQDRIADDERCMGLCDFQKRTIYLASRLSETERLKTFIHECLHAISAEHGFELPHRTVYALEESLVKFLKLNRWV